MISSYLSTSEAAARRDWLLSEAQTVRAARGARPVRGSRRGRSNPGDAHSTRRKP